MKKKIIKNDEGQVVPEKCDKCGGDVVLQIHGEPVYVCKECGKYFGTMPCNLKENKIMKKNVVKLNEKQLRKVVAESINSVLKEEGEGIEMMGSVPGESYGKYGNLMEKLDEVGDMEIANILHDCEKYGMDNDMLNRINGILHGFKGTLIHALDTRYW